MNTTTVCPNCQQWQHPTNDARVADCCHECRKRGFAPAPTSQERYAVAYARRIKADEHLSAVLHAKYGDDAGDMRYRAPETPEIAKAMQAHKDASKAAHDAWLAIEPAI